MPPRCCIVTLTDSRGIRHSVEVTAQSLFEAGVLGVTAFRNAGWVEEAPGVASRLEIEVRDPSVKHTVTLLQLQRWANRQRSLPRGATQARTLKAVTRRAVIAAE